MKKGIILVIMVLVSIIFLGACDRTYKNADKLEPTQIEPVNILDGVTMTIKEGTVSPAGLTVNLENNSDREFYYCYHFDLEVQIDDKWYQVPVLHQIMYDMPLSYLSPGDKREMEADWEDEYERLGKGKYRAVLCIQNGTGSEEFNPRYLAAEFKIE